MAPSLLTPSMLDTETFEAILFVTDLLEDLGAKYVIGGSVASIAHGLIRTTMDADLVTTLESDQQAEFIAALSEQFYVDEAVVREAIQRRSHFSLIHLKTMFKVDIFLVTDRPFDRQQIERRISVPLGTDSTDGWQGSERQWRDILGMIQTQQDALDLIYLRHWAAELAILDLLEQALTTCGAK